MNDKIKVILIINDDRNKVDTHYIEINKSQLELLRYLQEIGAFDDGTYTSYDAVKTFITIEDLTKEC